MQLAWGSYRFDSNSTLIGTDAQLVENDAGEPYAMQVVYDVEGWLSGTSQSTLTTAQQSFETAMKRQYQDLIFFQDDGSKSSIVMENSKTIDGVRIKMWKFDNTRGPEFATGRYFKFTATGEFPLTNSQVFLLNFTETVSYRGGGPVYVHMPAINAPPQRQLVQQLESFKVSQKGEAVGYLGYPNIPPPLFPGALSRSPDVERTSPRRRRRGRQNWKISWSYDFEAAYPLVGFPTLWTNVAA